MFAFSLSNNFIITRHDNPDTLTFAILNFKQFRNFPSKYTLQQGKIHKQNIKRL